MMEEQKCAAEKKKQLVVGYRGGAGKMALLYLPLLVPSILSLVVYTPKLVTLPLNHFLNNDPLKEPFRSLT